MAASTLLTVRAVACGVTAAEASDSALAPVALTARTLNW